MNLPRAILTVIDRVHPNGMSESVVFADVNIMLPEPVRLSSVRFELAGLEDSRELVSVEDRDRGTLYTITSKGRARLAQ